MTRPSSREHAIVIGGSLAGLMAARVLSDHFTRVTIVEHDALPERPEFRHGVPQDRHFHILLASGREAMQKLFPSLTDDLRDLGVPEVDMARDGGYLTPGGWTKRFPSGIVSLAVSRVTLEWYLRSQVRLRRNVEFQIEREVTRLLFDAERSAVTGVVSRSRRDGRLAELESDLVVDAAGRVVDASGRGSKGPLWLRELGYEPPAETVVNAHLGYASRWYEVPSDRSFDWRYLVVLSDPRTGRLRGGGILAVDGGRWTVTLAGSNKDYPPTDEGGFLDFARSLASPALYEAIADATPLSPVYGYRRTENRRHHYERLKRLPGRFLVMGDAYCGFNPIYGQGMTVAAREAIQLDTMLRRQEDGEGFPARFFRALNEIAKVPWLMATGEDLRFPETEGKRPGGVARLIQSYTDRVSRLLPYDRSVATRFLSVANLVDPPSVLFRPEIMARVAWHSLFTRSEAP
jgi:2-polyprenyl-6-methoxyphenol hydroxylase-like FAD-dependent oxidoreductase